ncbi:MAG: CocE/NonD family hydrolase [Oligoflexia bacterium]|nr:CocE/NonD family hydrolase [Oligoflexia bacterium]
MGLFLLIIGFAYLKSTPVLAEDKLYHFEIQKDYLLMRDGTKIAVSYYLPTSISISKNHQEKFPVIFEMLPYRKDDLFYVEDYQRYAYFAKRGYVLVKADVRGTGASTGAVPEREYSEEELDDGVEIIEQLSKKNWSNGNVAMWGKSWGGFNAIQVAMRNPPALKTIIAVHATDDLYKDDVHNIDGAMHVDTYELSMEGELAMPAAPNYDINEEFFKNRFDRQPWFFTYKREQNDGPFWRTNSLRFQYQKLKIPIFLIGGLLDGYRDFVPRILEKVKVPAKAVMGPWNHGLINGSQREDRLAPSKLQVNKIYDISFDLHFTTWTFKPGHRIRVAVTNAQFPMIWPSPYNMTTKLYTEGMASWIELPIIPFENRPVPNYSAPVMQLSGPIPNAATLSADRPHKIIVSEDRLKNMVSMETQVDDKTMVDGNIYDIFEKNIYTTNEKNPADSSYHGETEYVINLSSTNRKIQVSAGIDMHSDVSAYTIHINRKIIENGKLIREKNWQQVIPRNF